MRRGEGGIFAVIIFGILGCFDFLDFWILVFFCSAIFCFICKYFQLHLNVSHTVPTQAGSGAARRSRGKQDVVGLQPPERDLTRRQHNRSGDSPSHQEDRHRSIREEELITQEKINQVIAHIKILQNWHNDKIVDVSVAMQRQFLQIETLRRKESTRQRRTLLSDL